MIRLSSKSREDVLLWTRRQCSALKPINPDYRAIGIERDGNLGASVFFYDFRGKDCYMSLLIQDKRVVSRSTLHDVFEYPFWQAELMRVSAMINSQNHQSRSLIERVGFKLEGIRRQVYPNGADELMFGMLRSECPWLTGFERLADPHTGGAY